MLVRVKFFKVNALPQVCESNSFYFIEDGDNTEIFLTSGIGEVKRLTNSEAIKAILGNSPEVTSMTDGDRIAIIQSDVLVSSAGTPEANGLYTYRGQHNGKPFYNKKNDATDPLEYSIRFESIWMISTRDENNNSAQYYSIDIPDSVFDVTEWDLNDTVLPYPIIREKKTLKKIDASLLLSTEASAISDSDKLAVVQSDVIVSGAGEEDANGVYTYRGQYNGKPFYNKVGSISDAWNSSIAYDGAWTIYNDENGSLYVTDNDFEDIFGSGGGWYETGDIPLPPPTLTERKALKSVTKDALRGYKVYTALLSQTGTGAPVATVLENTIGEIVWTRNSTGLYSGTLASAFPLGKTIVNNQASEYGYFLIPATDDPSSGFGSYCYVRRQTNDYIAISFYDNEGANVDIGDYIVSLLVEIRVYN